MYTTFIVHWVSPVAYLLDEASKCVRVSKPLAWHNETAHAPPNENVSHPLGMMLGNGSAATITHGLDL